MTEVDNTKAVLYHYLWKLSVKVSKSTVQHLLNTPVGNSMRGISDALDALHIKNEVYQLPPSAEYFTQADAPFVTMLQTTKNPFCTVTKKNDFIVEFSNNNGKKQCIATDTFLKKWTGIVLFGETTKETSSDALYLLKNFCYYCSKYKVVIAIFLLLTINILTVLQQGYTPAMIVYLVTLTVGILVSVATLYKEKFNENFLERFCHIGEIVDCNKVLHSKGANIVGISLGELSLLYFFALFVFSSTQTQDFYMIAAICSAIAICFSIYSIIYQSLVMRKGCMLCMLINLVIWSNAIAIYALNSYYTFRCSAITLYMFVAISCICAIIGATIRASFEEYKMNIVLRNRINSLFKPDIFQNLLSSEPHLEETIKTSVALCNPIKGVNRLIIVTNPTCNNCSKAHHAIKELSLNIPISLILLTSPNNKQGERIAQIIITAYLEKGWNIAISLLEKWYETKDLSDFEKYNIAPEAKFIWIEQQYYCQKQKIKKAPISIYNGHYVPEVFPLSEQRYVLT